MTRPSDITPEIYEWAEIFCDEHIHTDDRELVARAFMVGQAAAPLRAGGLTSHQRDALHFIRSFIAENNLSPAMSDIQRHFGHSSKSPAHRVVHELAERGFIVVLPNRRRSITLTERAA